jgi:O-acetylserine/cysteine efflux transporter
VPRRHVLLALLVVLVWGANFVVIHVGLETFPPLLFVALRFAVLAPLGLLIIRRGPGVPARWVILIGLFISAGQFGLLFVSLDRGMPAGLASLILQVQVLFTLAIAIAVLGERPSRNQVGGAAIALTGLAIIAVGRADGVPIGAMMLCIAAGASWGIGNICTRVARPPDAIALVMWSALVPPIPLFVLSLAFEGTHDISRALSHPQAGGILALAYVVIASTAFAYGAWTWLLARHPASQVAPFTLLVPVIGIAAAWIALGERPGLAEFAGAVVVLAGLALTTWDPRLARAAGDGTGGAAADSVRP